MAGGKKRRTGKGGGSAKRRRAALPGSLNAPQLFGVDRMVHSVLANADELLDVEDPLEAEDWASGILGVTYKLPAPFEVREEVERSFGPALVKGAERMRSAAGIAVLCALAGVTGDEFGAREAAARMAARGVPRPRWADVVGTPGFLGGYTVADPFGDQIGYHLLFAYPGRAPHLLMALYDENLGGIIKDAFVAGLREDSDVRGMLEADPDVVVEDVDPEKAAARIRGAIGSGDLFIDNDWTDDFKHNRALVLSRMRLLQPAEPGESEEPEEPLDDESRDRLIDEFFATGDTPRDETSVGILDHCLMARCDYGDGDPLRWSPIAVELFMLDYVPRKASLSDVQIAELPDVLRAWVRFCLTKRGLEERFIVEAEEAVGEYAGEYQKSVRDPADFGPAKAISQAMTADGVDLTDQSAVDAWLADFNSRPDEERCRILGPPPEQQGAG